MPRRTNTSNENARRRREIRINILSRYNNLRNEVRNVSNLIANPRASTFTKEHAKDILVLHAIEIFTTNGQHNALPRTRSKIVEKLINAFPHALQRYMNRRRRPTRTANSRTVAKYSATIPRSRNVFMAKGPNGKPVVVYFANN